MCISLQLAEKPGAAGVLDDQEGRPALPLFPPLVASKRRASRRPCPFGAESRAGICHGWLPRARGHLVRYRSNSVRGPRPIRNSPSCSWHDPSFNALLRIAWRSLPQRLHRIHTAAELIRLEQQNAPGLPT